MSHIVEKLRQLEDFYLARPIVVVCTSMTDFGALEAQTIVDYAKEARAEIERLRASNADLLAALESAQDEITYAHSKFIPGEKGEAIAAVVRAAIAKARGKA